MKTRNYYHCDLMVDVTFSSEATIAVVQGKIGDETYVWEGTAKRSPGDKFDSEIGLKLAMSRAFARASKQLERQGNGKVKCVDDNANRPKIPAPKFHTVPRRRHAAPKAHAVDKTIS